MREQPHTAECSLSVFRLQETTHLPLAYVGTDANSEEKHRIDTEQLYSVLSLFAMKPAGLLFCIKTTVKQEEKNLYLKHPRL